MLHGEHRRFFWGMHRLPFFLGSLGGELWLWMLGNCGIFWIGIRTKKRGTSPCCSDMHYDHLTKAYPKMLQRMFTQLQKKNDQQKEAGDSIANIGLAGAWRGAKELPPAF